MPSPEMVVPDPKDQLRVEGLRLVFHAAPRPPLPSREPLPSLLGALAPH